MSSNVYAYGPFPRDIVIDVQESDDDDDGVKTTFIFLWL